MANSAGLSLWRSFVSICFLIVSIGSAIQLRAAFPLSIPQRPTLPLQRPTKVGWLYAWGGQSNSDAVTTNAHGRYGYVAIKATAQADFAIKPDGTFDMWTYPNIAFSTNVPPEATNLVAIAAGDAHALALRADGSIVTWGDNSGGQLDVPSSVTNVVAIEASRGNSMALLADGSVVVWGGNRSNVWSIPPQATDVVAIGYGLDHAGALRSDGAIVLWGSTQDGKCNIPPGLGPVVAIDLGIRHTLVLQANGKPVAWGDNSYFELNVPADLTNAIDIATGLYHGVALRSDTTVADWGLGFGSQRYPGPIPAVFAISAGGDHSMVLHGLSGEVLTAAGHVAVQNGFVIGAGIEMVGNGYQTTPAVTLEGGGGTGAQVVATVSDGKVVKLTVVNPGSGYTSVPVLKISPPEGYELKIGQSVSAIRLNFKVVPGNKYRLESSTDGQNWISNNTFAATSGEMSQDATVTSPPTSYRLQQVGAAGTAVRGGEFITAINVTQGGGGYVTAPAVAITGGGGTGATATANISSGVVVSFTIISPGSGYTSTPQVVVDPPPSAPGRITVSPTRLNITQYVQPYFKYELDSSPDLNAGWTALEPAALTKTNRIVRDFPIGSGNQFFLIKQVP